MPLPDVVSGLLLSVGSEVQILSGTPESTAASLFRGLQRFFVPPSPGNFASVTRLSPALSQRLFWWVRSACSTWRSINAGKKPDASMMKWCANNAIQDVSVLAELLSHMTMHKLMRYADAQYEIRIAATKTPEYIRYYSMANLLADYRDYHAARFPVFLHRCPNCSVTAKWFFSYRISPSRCMRDSSLLSALRSTFR